ncbi:MAG: hypothetical protein A2Y89_02865 [Chloroflexi bacterium RBG_13_51_18]|nr:MAG: hypothetical protein A2Y89_02865 [Chloroflexi bacterium RBG_13_51_18]
MYSIDIINTVDNSISVEATLVYIGTFLIGFEFIRKIDRIQVILSLLILSPFKHAANAFPITRQQRQGYKFRNAIKKITWLHIFYFLILLPLLLPLSLLSLIPFLITTFLSVIDNLLNYLWRKLITNFKDIAKKIATILIEKNKKYHNLQPKPVVELMINTKIPFIPVVGIILILVSFFMYIF